MIIVALVIIGVLFGVEKGLTSYLIETHEGESHTIDDVESLSKVYWLGTIVIGIFLVFYFKVRHHNKKEKIRKSMLNAVGHDWTIKK